MPSCFAVVRANLLCGASPGCYVGTTPLQCTAVLVGSKFALDCSRLRERGHIDILFCAVACVNFRANLKKTDCEFGAKQEIIMKNSFHDFPILNI